MPKASTVFLILIRGFFLPIYRPLFDVLRSVDCRLRRECAPYCAGRRSGVWGFREEKGDYQKKRVFLL